MECGVDYDYLRNAGHSGGAALDTHNMRGGVQRSKVNAEAQFFDYLGGNESGLSEISAAMDNAVSDCFDFADILDTSGFGIGKVGQYDFGCHCVVGHGDFLLQLLSRGQFVLNASVNADTLANSLCENASACGVEKLIFKRGASGVYYEYFHFNIPFRIKIIDKKQLLM